MIEVKHLKKAYRIEKQEIPVLEDISLTIHDGEFTVIMGESGCGKSTFLNCISGLLKASDGEILLDGKDLNRATRKEMEAIRLHQFGFIFQDNYMIDNLTILENVAMTRLLYAKDGYEKAMSLLKQMRIEHLADKYPAHVSGGEKQRVAIARAMMNDPAILFADEPTASLDKYSAKEIMEIFAELNQKGQTILMVTHSAGIGAYGNRILVMDKGCILDDKYLEGTLPDKTKVIQGLVDKV